MKFQTPNCPKCGEQARGAADWTPGCALLNFDESGNAEYAGGTDMFWDGQLNGADLHRHCSTPPNQADVIELQCSEGHLWITPILPEGVT